MNGSYSIVNQISIVSPLFARACPEAGLYSLVRSLGSDGQIMKNWLIAQAGSMEELRIKAVALGIEISEMPASVTTKGRGSDSVTYIDYAAKEAS